VYNRRNSPPQWRQLFDTSVYKHITSIVFQDNSAWIITLDPYFEIAANPGNLLRFDLTTGMTRRYDLSVKGKKVAPDLIASNTGGQVIVSLMWGGLALYNADKDSFLTIPVNNEDPNGFHAMGTSVGVQPYIDRDNNVWIGTDKGINIFSPRQQHFFIYGSDLNTSGMPMPRSYEVSGFLQTPDGDVFVSYYSAWGGIQRLDSNLHEKKRYLFPGNGILQNPKNQLWCLFQDDSGIVWAPAQDRTIMQLDPVHDRYQNKTYLADATGCINTLFKDGKGNIWIGSWSKGLCRIDAVTRSFRSFTTSGVAAMDPITRVFCLFIDNDSLVWIGTDHQGMLCFDPRKEIFTAVYSFDEKDRRSISSNIVNEIIPYNSDTLLLATAAGINIFSKKQHAFSVVSHNNGLPNNYVQTIALDRHRRLWAGCISGELCSMEVPTGKITHYDISDGIINIPFENRPFLVLKNGCFLAPTIRGFLVFNPDSVQEKAPPPPVTITGCSVSGKNVPVDTLIDSDLPLTLSYKENNLSIGFAALQFTTPGSFKYYYQLEGVDKDWVAAGKEQEAQYSSLSGGHYLFKVKCAGRDGAFCTKTTTLSINVVPPFWHTTWFYLLTFSSAVCLLFFLAQQYANVRKQKQLLRLNYEKQIAVGELNALRAQMNPHFIFNSLNAIYNFILKNEADNAAAYLGKFSRLVRLILDNSRSEWVLLENELKALALYMELESLRFEQAFSYAIRTSPDIGASLIPPMIIQPYVENAIRHGLLLRKQPGGMLAVEVWKENGQVFIQIEDNGIGRSAAERIKQEGNVPHQSHGMQITAERLQIVNDVYKVNATVAVTDLYNDEGAATGTRILINIQHKTHANINH
jgi:hypothetical protein